MFDIGTQRVLMLQNTEVSFSIAYVSFLSKGKLNSKMFALNV